MIIIHIYESHLGGLYTKKEYFEPSYCESCGDSDSYLGKDSCERHLL